MIKKGHNYYVYIITDESRTRLETGLAGVLSIGIKQLENKLTDDIKNACRYLVFWESYEDAMEAITREKKLKRLSKRKKMQLISTANPEWHFLNEEVHKEVK